MDGIHQNSLRNQNIRFSKIDLKLLARIASSVNGFACGLDIVKGSSLSAYHDVKTLLEQKKTSYAKGDRDYKTGDDVTFLSEYKTLGDFYRALNFFPPSYSLVQQCYGGIFAARTENIFQHNMTLWGTLQKALVSFHM